MHDSKKVLSFPARVRQLATTLKTMSVSVEDSKTAMALLHGVSLLYNSVISALDAARTDDIKYSFDFVQRRCAQEEHRQAQCALEDFKSSECAALFAKFAARSKKITQPIPAFTAASKKVRKVLQKFPYLARPGHFASAHLHRPAVSHLKTVILTDSSTYTDQAFQSAICLFTNPISSHFFSHTLKPSASLASL